MSQNQTLRREMPALDKIHILFLVYSGAHNVINAFSHAHNFIFFLFVVVGILSVELMLWAVYTYWKDGRLVGPMLSRSLWAGTFAMAYATTGILATAQGGGVDGWLSFYYAWILPTSAPAMFLFAFLIQSVDPITAADRDAAAYEHQVGVEQRREVLDGKMLALDNRRNVRKLKAHVQHERMDMLWKEAMHRRTRRTLRIGSRIEMPTFLKSIGVPVDKVQQAESGLWFGLGRLRLPQYSGDSGSDGSMNHGEIDVTPGGDLGK